MNFLRGLFRNIGDHFYRWQQWWLRRRSAIRAVEQQRDDERIRHAEEVRVLQAQIALRDQEAAGLVEINKELRASVAANIAVLARRTAEAQNNPRFDGT